MNLNEARQLVETNQHLIGRFFKNDEISDIIIVPKHGFSMSDVALCVINDTSYEHLLIGHTDFDVIVLLDLDDFAMGGTLFWKYLQDVLKPLR